MIKNPFKGLTKSKPDNKHGDKPLTYNEAKKLARHENPDVRRGLASRDDVNPEILYYLADDESTEVRRTIAVNTGAPRQVDIILARDSDDDVRIDLAGKIAKLTPGLSADEQDTVRRMTYQVLEILARDQAIRVRQILSEILKDVAHAPPEVIKRLAQDAEIVVSGPVLEHSPLLTDEDILEIIVKDPIDGVLAAISRRPAVSEPITDAIVEAGNEDDIALLLANHSAQIREETLDHIIDLAVDVEQWHTPLVKRPKLPAKASVRLARFVADNLLEILAKRQDLDPETIDEVKAIVRKRLDEDAGLSGKSGKKKKSRKKKKTGKSKAKELYKEAKTMHEAGMLGEATIEDSLRAGDNDFIVAALAVLAGVSLSVVEKTISTRSAKGIVSVSWKSGLPMDLALQIQKKLAKIPSKEILYEKSGGAYPLSDEEMDWQLEFFRDS